MTCTYKSVYFYITTDIEIVRATIMLSRTRTSFHRSTVARTYFQALAPILDHDSSLLAVSAFEDNGFTGRVFASYGTTFFPVSGEC